MKFWTRLGPGREMNKPKGKGWRRGSFKLANLSKVREGVGFSWQTCLSRQYKIKLLFNFTIDICMDQS